MTGAIGGTDPASVDWLVVPGFPSTLNLLWPDANVPTWTLQVADAGVAVETAANGSMMTVELVAEQTTVVVGLGWVLVDAAGVPKVAGQFHRWAGRGGPAPQSTRVTVADGPTVTVTLAAAGPRGPAGPPGVAGAPTGTAGGDLGGTYPDPTVPGLAGKETPVGAQAKADAAQAYAIQRANHSGSQAQATIVGLDTTLAAKADLVGGLLATSQVPPLSITDTFTVATQAAMLALTAQRGDVAVRTDTSTTWILVAEPASTLAGWKQLATPTDLVLSVNGKQGAVVLGKADVGLGSVDNTADTAKAFAASQISSGALAPARLATGTPAAGMYPDGGGAWTTLPTSGGGAPSGTAGGDLGGTYPDPTLHTRTNKARTWSAADWLGIQFISRSAGFGTPVGRIYASPLWLPAATIDGFAVNVGTAGGSGSVCRTGLYSDAGGRPVTLLRDFGTVTTTAAGDRPSTLPLASPYVWAGGRIWVALVVQGAICNMNLGTSGSTETTAMSPAMGPVLGGNAAGIEATGTTTTGVLPASFPASQGSGFGANVAFRMSTAST